MGSLDRQVAAAYTQQAAIEAEAKQFQAERRIRADMEAVQQTYDKLPELLELLGQYGRSSATTVTTKSRLGFKRRHLAWALYMDTVDGFSLTMYLLLDGTLYKSSKDGLGSFYEIHQISDVPVDHILVLQGVNKLLAKYRQ